MQTFGLVLVGNHPSGMSLQRLIAAYRFDRTNLVICLCTFTLHSETGALLESYCW